MKRYLRRLRSWESREILDQTNRALLTKMFSHTSQHTELHKTILRGEEQPTLQRCEDCCSLYHCPFCVAEMFKPTIKSKCLKHLQGHRRRAIRHKEFFIFKCHLKCRTGPHFHCVSCTSTFMRKDGFLKHLAMCDNKKPKITVVELKSEKNSPTPDLHLTASESGSTDGHKSQISEDAQKIRRRKANFEQYLFPKMAVSEETSGPGPTDSEMADQGSTGEGRIMEEQVRTDGPSKSPVDEGDPLVLNLSVVDHNGPETTVSNSAANPHPIEADLTIKTLVNEMFTGHTPVESTIPQRSKSDAQDLCPFCGLMLHRKNLQVHLRRKHPDQVLNQEKPASAQVKNPKQQRLPLRKQQKFHVTILNEGSSPGPISLAENEYKCLFCKKTGEYPALVAHVQTHERSVVKHGGYKIYKCHLGCIDSGHYHCCYCRQSIIRKNLFINHVQKCASTKVHIPSTEPSKECLETCALKPTNFPSSHSISTVSATCDPIPKPLTTPGLPRALICPPVASTSGPPIISAPCVVDHSASKTEHFSGTPPTPSSLTDSKTAVLHPTIVMPSDIQNIVSANPTECIFSSNKKTPKCRPKRTMCCFCNKILNKKNIKTHIQRRHSLSTPDVNINHHHPSTCIDRTNGISAVGGTVTGPVRPVHAQKYTRGHLHKEACEFEKG